MEEIRLLNTEVSFTNKELTKATKQIFKIGETVRKCALETAKIVSDVSEKECYKDDGFKNVHEWAMQTFGFQKTSSYSMLKIGKEYIEEVKNASGKVIGYHSNLLPNDEINDFSASQLDKILPLGHDLAKELVESGELSPAMSCREIVELVKSKTTKEETEETEAGETEAGETEETEETEVVEEISIEVVDNEGNTYIVPTEVLDKYKVTE